MLSAFVQRQIADVRAKYPDLHTEDDASGVILMLPTYPIPPLYHQSQVRLAIRIGPLYPVEKLDLFWIEPALQRRDGVPLPNLMNPSVVLGGETWAQISWHDTGPYEPARATLIGYLTGLHRWFDH